MKNPGIQSVSIARIENNNIESVSDMVSVEEPLEISLCSGPLNNRQINRISVTMRTPGQDRELAAGFLFTEGLIQNAGEILGLNFTNSLPGTESNTILAELNPDVEFNNKNLQRNFYTSSSCGVCGKASIDAIKTTGNVTNYENHFTVPANILYQLPDHLKAAQTSFTSTGGIHASALFDLNGNLQLLREDVGRHNALDKLIGVKLLQNQLPLNRQILLLSGRASFELVQKSAMAGIGMICAIGAPSSLAIETAAEFGITLVGFLKFNKFNIYTGENRIKL